jgi:multiple sugar transport system substrate-binding protein
MASHRWRRRLASVALAALTVSGIAGCGGGEAGPPTLNWYINPDSGGQEEIASRCTDASGGQYRIAVSVLPRESSEQREQLIRRLAANDSSIDLMSLDPPYIPEFAEAGFLAPMPAEVAARASEGVLPSALAGATWQGQLVTVPFWANTQLLWYKKSAASAAGLDMSQPVTWDQLIQAAQSQNTQFAVQGRRAESLTVWINALIESGGGSIITDPSVDAPENVQLGLDSPASAEAARIMRTVADTGIGGPALSTAGEDENASAFENGSASFMVNWPFVWPRAQEAVEGGTLDQAAVDDFGWALYPQVTAGTPSAPPLGGINLGVGAFTNYPDLAYAATECITSAENQSYYFTTNGNPASRASVYDDPAVVAEFPMAGTIRESLELAAPRPQTPYYNEVSGSLQRVYHPPSSVVPGVTGPEAAALIQAVLAKEELL